MYIFHLHIVFIDFGLCMYFMYNNNINCFLIVLDVKTQSIIIILLSENVSESINYYPSSPMEKQIAIFRKLTVCI